MLLPLLALAFASCGIDEADPRWVEAARMTGGDPLAGQMHIREYGCGSCHTIPGIPGADSQVGPPLTALSRRMYIGGVLPNEPQNLVRWILDPPAVAPRTAMPDLEVSEQDARDIAAYLYGLD